MENFQIIVLSLSGLGLFYASSTRLINPLKAIFLQTYFENPENTLESDIDLVSEIRGVGAVMVFGGIVTLPGTILPDFRLTSFVVASVIFCGVASGRLLSLFIDGRPGKSVFRAATAEIALSVLNMLCLISILI